MKLVHQILDKVFNLFSKIENKGKIIEQDFLAKKEYFTKIMENFSNEEISQLKTISLQNFYDYLQASNGENLEQIQKLFENFKPFLYENEPISSIEIQNREKENEEIQDYFIKKLHFEVEEIEDDKIILRKNKRILSLSREYSRWSGENLVQTFSDEKGVPLERVFEISTLSEYLSNITSLSSTGVSFLSRGQKDCTFDLVPSLLREKYSENELIEKFTRSASFYDKSILNKEKFSTMAYGQHFGLPTRLLDFTEAHLLAMLFAVEDYKYIEKPSIVYLVDTTQYHNEVINYRVPYLDFSNSENSDYLVKRHEGRALFIKLEDSNDRVHFQKGYFLFCQQAKYEEDISKMLSNSSYVFLIRPENKQPILEELFSLGINFESIYPDIDNLVKNLKFRG